jgi:hypothetical protein
VPSDRITFRSSNNITQVEIPEGSTQIDPLDPRTRVAGAPNEEDDEFRLRGHESRSFRYLVKMTGNSGWVEFTITSKHGGTDTGKLNIKIGD